MVLGLGGGSIAQTGGRRKSNTVSNQAKMLGKVLEEDWTVKEASEKDALGESWSTTPFSSSFNCPTQ